MSRIATSAGGLLDGQLASSLRTRNAHSGRKSASGEDSGALPFTAAGESFERMPMTPLRRNAAISEDSDATKVGRESSTTEVYALHRVISVRTPTAAANRTTERRRARRSRSALAPV